MNNNKVVENSKTAGDSKPAQNHKLWYNKAAASWKQGLPIGNGRIGAVIQAGVDSEIWSMTEVTYWSGQAEHIEGPTDAREKLEIMRERFFAGDYVEGDRLAKEALQPKKQNFGTNLPMCDVVFRYGREGEQLHRELNLDTAISHVAYISDDCQITRETFASHVDDIVVSRISADRSGQVSFSLRIQGNGGELKTALTNRHTIIFQGQALERMHSNGECGVLCDGEIAIALKGGVLTGEGDALVVSGADEAIIYYAVNTNYGRSTEEWATQSGKQLQSALDKGYDKIKRGHIADYQALYGRVTLELGQSTYENLPTDERMARARSGQLDDPGLAALFYQYGRYLTISGSREGSPLPMNLQGIWNDGEANRMAWSCDYHLDINTQMNYFPTEISNLAECHVPLMNYIEQLSKAGRLAAEDFYGCEGWVAHVFSNVWGFAAPGWETSWGLNVTGGLWLAVHMKEHYEYGLDRDFLVRQAYPVLKEASLFFLDYMVVHPQHGWLVTGPSNSPENSFYPGSPADGGQQLSMGTTMDQMLVRDLFTFCLEAAELLQTDPAFRDRLQHAIQLLPPLLIGKKGQLQEWLEDYEEAQPEHRHLAHLYGLYPGGQITPQKTPELSAALRNTLTNRMAVDGLEDIEFTAALFASGFSRLYEGERAVKHIMHLISELCFDNMLSYSKAGVAGAEENIFVIDGNFGGAAAVADMLLQSQAGEIHLLPALPSVWATGSFRGLRAKGNVEVDAVWEDGQLKEATLRAGSAGTAVVRYGAHTIRIELAADSLYRIDPASFGAARET
ncbi:glycoside hydrolase family 95 protein [Paenibacillaceae bacterium]|nr:glycoside hydrolase family 95 protein [Paenibacillaceae bacterium]